MSTHYLGGPFENSGTETLKISADGSLLAYSRPDGTSACNQIFTIETGVGGTTAGTTHQLTDTGCNDWNSAPTFVPAEWSPSCPGFHLFGVRGSRANTSDTSVDNTVTSTFAKLLGGKVPGLRFTPIKYDAIPLGYGSPTAYAGGLYDSSVLTGTDALWRAIEQFITACPHVYIGLVGYSQGEQVVRDVYHNDLVPSDQQHIAFVAGYGDPVFDHVQQLIDRKHSVP